MNMNAMFHPRPNSEIPEREDSEMGVKIVSHNPFPNGTRPGSAARTLKVR